MVEMEVRGREATHVIEQPCTAKLSTPVPAKPCSERGVAAEGPALLGCLVEPVGK